MSTSTSGKQSASAGNSNSFWSGVISTCVAIFLIKSIILTPVGVGDTSTSTKTQVRFDNAPIKDVEGDTQEKLFIPRGVPPAVVAKPQEEQVAKPHQEQVESKVDIQVKPRQGINDWGYDWKGQVDPLNADDETTYGGWYDVQCLGVFNDFCRLAGNHIFTCALAGSDRPYSPEGLYSPYDFDVKRVNRNCAHAIKEVKVDSANGEKKKKVVIVVPMTSRGMKINALNNSPLQRIVLNSLERTLKDDRKKFDVQVYAGFDVGDAYWDPLVKPSRILSFDVKFVKCECKSMVCNTNCIMRQAHTDGADYVFRGNDDTEFKGRDWITPFVQQLSQFDPPNVGVVGPSCKQGNTEIMTHDFTHLPTHMKIFENNYYPPVFDNYFCDDWVSNVYGKSRTKQLKNVEVWHHVKITRYKHDFDLVSNLKPLYVVGDKKINAFIKQMNV
eukprot:m.25658 g.25658  ORF g.25658 m.25658 type:complete len:442 (+) comp15113_c0_seq1:241-1566(+)